MDPLLVAILFFALAAVLAIVDLLVPSGGVLAVASFLSAIVTVYFGYQSSSLAGTTMLIVILVAIPIFLAVALRIWPHTPLGRRIILPVPGRRRVSNGPNGTPANSATLNKSELLDEASLYPSSAADHSAALYPMSSLDDPLTELVGQVGVARNSLLPSGHVRIEHRNYNALCESGFIEAGQRVEVIAVRERNLIVVATHRPLTGNSHQRQDTAPIALGESLLDRPAEELGLDSLEN